MNMLDRFAWICQILCLIFLSLGFFLINIWQISIAVILILVLFCSGWYLKWRWMPDLLLAVQCLLAVAGCLLGVSLIWMLLSVSAGLAVWDLLGYRTKLRQGTNISNRSTIESTHLIYLVLIIGLGMIISSSTMLIKFRISFWFALLLGMLVIVSLVQVIRHLRKL